MKKNILITGGAGFVGSNLALYLKKRFKSYKIVCFDNLIRKGSELNVSRLKDAGIKFIKGDIRNKVELMKLKDIHVIVECSAEPSVLAGYRDPNYTLDTNLMGTINCLELARQNNAQFLFLSTSRVYPIGELEKVPYQELKTRFDWKKNTNMQGCSYQGIDHQFPLMGVRSLYGASKLASELVCMEYGDMFGIDAVINRFGVIAGPWQMGKIDQGLIGFWVAQHKFNGALSYIGYNGSGKQVRDVIHVDDVCEIIALQLQNMKRYQGKVFNIGGGRKRSASLCELTTVIQKITKINMAVKVVKEARKSDVRIYITDNSFVIKQTGWQPKRSLEEIIVDVDSWMTKYYDVLQPILK